MVQLNINKDPTNLPCPVCGHTVDAGATWKSMKLLRRNELTCQNCGAQLKKKGKSFFSSIAIIISGSVGFYREELSPWDVPIQVIAVIAFFVFFWMETKSVHLVEKERKDLENT